MKKKTFLVTLVLFIVFINSSMLLISYLTLREQISAGKEKVLAEHYVISSGLIGDMQALKGRGGDPEASMEELMRNYARYSQNRGNELAVSCDGEWIYSSAKEAPAEGPEGILAQADQSKRLVFLQKKPTLQVCVYGRFPAPFESYGLWYKAGSDGTFESWRRMKNMLFLVSGAITFVFALFLIKFLDILFKPLREISITSRTIAAGDYHTRLHVKGQDEIAVMADNFNRMAEQVESHIGLLQETADKKQQFIDNFAHELRTPLTAIYGYAEYLQRASVSKEERYECTRFILSECERLEHMAYQLLDLSAMRTADAEDCPVEEIFGRTCEIMRVKAEKKQITVLFYSRRERVAGNRELLITLLTNLVDNAIKASPAGSVIKVSAVREKDSVRLEVTDRGIGMTKEQIAHVKEPFYRVDKSRSRAAGGAGLGLAICEKIVELHRGRLEFLSPALCTGEDNGMEDRDGGADQNASDGGRKREIGGNGEKQDVDDSGRKREISGGDGKQDGSDAGWSLTGVGTTARVILPSGDSPAQ